MIHQILIFEGQDGSGKTTIKKAFSKTTNEKYTCIDRMYPSDIIYANKYVRGKEFIVQKIKEMKSFNVSIQPIYIFIYSEVSSTVETFEDRKEAYDLKDIIDDKLRFNDFYNVSLSSYDRKIKINRTNKTVDECVKELIKELKKI